MTDSGLQFFSTAEQHLFSIPTRLGGMGIFDPVELAKAAYTTSRASTNMVVNAIKNNADFVVSSQTPGTCYGAKSGV